MSPPKVLIEFCENVCWHAPGVSGEKVAADFANLHGARPLGSNDHVDLEVTGVGCVRLQVMGCLGNRSNEAPIVQLRTSDMCEADDEEALVLQALSGAELTEKVREFAHRLK